MTSKYFTCYACKSNYHKYFFVNKFFSNTFLSCAYSTTVQCAIYSLSCFKHTISLVMANVAFLAIYSLGDLLQPVHEGQVVSLNCSRLILGKKVRTTKHWKRLSKRAVKNQLLEIFRGRPARIMNCLRGGFGASSALLVQQFPMAYVFQTSLPKCFSMPL